MKAARKRFAATDIDQSVRFSSVGFHHYNTLEQARGESAGPRLTFFKGVLEIMSPSVHHELLKTRLARLIEVYAEEKDIPLEGCGSWTLKDRAKQAGLEPDECYVVGSVDDADRPDFAIEVVWTSGGVNKLEVYRALGVPEVWFWQDGKLPFFISEEGNIIALFAASTCQSSTQRCLRTPWPHPAKPVRCARSVASFATETPSALRCLLNQVIPTRLP